LGAAEAGFFPGVIVYLSHWFIHEDRAKARATSWPQFHCSFVVGSPIAGWILGPQWSPSRAWRWLFVPGGMPAILLGTLRFLSEDLWAR